VQHVKKGGLDTRNGARDMGGTRGQRRKRNKRLET